MYNLSHYHLFTTLPNRSQWFPLRSMPSPMMGVAIENDVQSDLKTNRGNNKKGKKENGKVRRTKCRSSMVYCVLLVALVGDCAQVSPTMVEWVFDVQVNMSHRSR